MGRLRKLIQIQPDKQRERLEDHIEGTETMQTVITHDDHETGSNMRAMTGS